MFPFLIDEEEEEDLDEENDQGIVSASDRLEEQNADREQEEEQDDQVEEEDAEGEDMWEDCKCSVLICNIVLTGPSLISGERGRRG